MSSKAADPLALLKTPDRLGRYTLGRQLGQGGMASIYLAHASGAAASRGPFALKVIHPHLASDTRLMRRFLHEARIAARLSHPNVCGVVDSGEDEGLFFLVMEYLEGLTLGELVARVEGGVLAPEVAARVTADVACGLHAAHELRCADGRSAEVVHRDVSPSNIFVLASGTTKVLDFGVARSAEPDAVLTAVGELLGRIGYMSPEQARGQSVDRRADVFALGVVLWETTVGRRLFKSRTERQTLETVARAEVPTPSSLRPDYPPALERVVLRALRRDPGERYASAAALADDLERFLARRGVTDGHARVAALVRPFVASAAPLAATGDGPVAFEDDGSIAFEDDGPAAFEDDGPVAATAAAPPASGPVPAAQPSGTAARARRRAGGRLLAVGAVVVLVVIATVASGRAAVDALRRHGAADRAAGSAAAQGSFLDLDTTPRAEVFEHTHRLGVTPLARLPLAPGRHTLRLVPLDGRSARTLDVELRPGETAARTLAWP